MVKKTQEFIQDFSFYEQLWYYYNDNRKKIRSRYNDLTKKFLAYNDRSENSNAYLRPPQFEALEIYVFIKEFMNNPQVYQMFDDWRKQKNAFSDSSYYTVHKGGQRLLIDVGDEQNEKIFKQMEKYKEDYPNYIYALTMGLGKTILMATSIFYEFLLAKKYPKDKRFCHNALVFAPDTTILESLREIMTFDKTKVVPPEYANVLDSNVKFHFLDNTEISLNSLDDSDFNIIISNNQKIIVKRKRTESKPADILFGENSLLSSLYGTDGNDDTGENCLDETSLIENQRFKKICRLPQLGIYVDESHHLFGSNLESELHSDNPEKTSLRNTINIIAKNTSIVACYNYTGTPYVNKQILPEVVYAYGLRESIQQGYLKDANLKGFENVKSKEFIVEAVTTFWKTYGGKLYEGLNPKFAIFASTIEEATKEVRPILEEVLTSLNISINKILINVGDKTITKDEDIRNFNNLDKVGTEGNNKQFIILVGKGTEGWNCRSLLGIAMFRSPKSKIFVLQSTMRCLRKLTDTQLTASVFLSKENYDILNEELNKNFNMEIKDLTNKNKVVKNIYKVRVMPPLRKIKLKRIWHEYSLKQKEYSTPIDFGIKTLDTSIYERTVYEKSSLKDNQTVKETNVDNISDERKYSLFTLTAEIARYLNVSCKLINRILSECIDNVDKVIEKVSLYNKILYDLIIPKIFNTLYEVSVKQKSEYVDVVLLKEPKNSEYYEFSAKEDLVIKNDNTQLLSKEEIAKSFHADTYCFDSNPEQKLFIDYIKSDEVEEIYFTGMFTADQGDLSIQYYDKYSGRLRKYYPDFLAKLKDGSYELIEVKGDNMIDNDIVKAKKEAAEEMAVASGIQYKIYPGSKIMNMNVLKNKQETQNTLDNI